MNLPEGIPSAWRPDPGQVQALASVPRLLGRDEQLQALLSVLLGLEDEPMPGALLIGETGMGKTRLLRTVDGSVPGVLHGRARLGDKLVPYATLARWLQQWVDTLPNDAAQALSHALKPLLPAAQTPGSGAAQRFGPPEVGTVHALMLRAAPGVTAWTLDDLHLADDASAEWLLHFVQYSPPTALPWVISAQPPWPGTLTEAVLEAMAGLAGVRSILLGPLNHGDVFEWLTEAVAQPLSTDRAEAFIKRVMQASQGQPLHLHWLLREIEHSGLTDGASVATASAAPSSPPDTSSPSLATLLGQSLSGLNPQALALARAAAVAGQDFEEAPACDFTGLTTAEFAAALDELRTHGLWQEDDFSHIRIREAARLATPEAMAKAMHAHWADWLERDGTGHPARTAAHWLAAGLDVRALPGLQAAAHHAQNLGCMPERMACLVRAANIAEQHQQLDLAFDCCCEAFEAHTEAVRHTQGETLLAQMERLARTPAQQARASTQAAWHAMVHGHLETAIRHGERALNLATAVGSDALLGPARQHLGTALGVAGQLQRALPLLEHALPWAQKQLPADEQASLLGNLAAVLDNLGRAEAARRHHLAALALTARHSDGTHRATLLANYATSRLEAGDPLGARELARKAQDLIEAHDAQSSTAGFVAVLMAPCERTLGRYADALDWCDRAERVLSSHNPSRTPVAQLQRAHVWMDLGQHERALQLLSGAGLPLGRELPARHAVRWMLLLARAQTRQGLDASASLNEAQQRLPAEGWPDLGLLLRAEQALLEPGAQAALELRAVAVDAAQQGLQAVALSAWLQCALLAASGARDPALAKEAADAALALMVRGVETPHADRALRWLAPAKALLAAGETLRARGLLLRGQQWLRETTEDHVPAWARGSFAQLHPLNLLLQDAPLPPV